jgi:hypothetical protein
VLARNWEISKRTISSNLHKIKHWQIVCENYTAAPDVEATWFIDPPYKGDPGMGYGFSSSMMDYDELSRWALSRRGEVICCEGQNGDYLPFRALKSSKGVAGKVSMEKIYYRSGHEHKQPDLFAKEPISELLGSA